MYLFRYIFFGGEGGYRILIHYYLVLLYGDIAQGQHWLRWWLVAWRHQAITWTNVVFSLVMISGVYLRAISQQLSQGTVVYNKFENILLKLTVTSTSPRDLWVKINEGVGVGVGGGGGGGGGGGILVYVECCLVVFCLLLGIVVILSLSFRVTSLVVAIIWLAQCYWSNPEEW